jgi:hypothetical protein
MNHNKDKQKARRIVRDMYQLSVRYGVRNVKDLISVFRLDTYIDENLEEWTLQTFEDMETEHFEQINLN